MSRSDEELARGVQQGKNGDLIRLVEQHYDALVGYLYRLNGGDRMLSEDMVQETFLRVLRGIGGYDYPRPFKPWLYAIATNLARNHFKRADTRYAVAADDEVLVDVPEHDPPPEEILMLDDDMRDLAAALRVLPDHQRETIILRYCQELSLVEIAEVLAVPVGTVKSRLNLGLKRLREAMEEPS
ncbi:MAG: RNA polymerase sigma factor [Chloroflexi bacterium]|nr:RNA polymerase sigma factor [Chloroflexota bacterium]